jgi:5-methylcytosine-specific restriction endonuclease McrA
MDSKNHNKKRRRWPMSVRLKIAYQHDWKCAVCKKKLGPIFDIDHRIALHRGGLDTFTNLQPLCRERGCHNRKTDREFYERLSARREIESGQSRYFDPQNIKFIDQLDYFKFKETYNK